VVLSQKALKAHRIFACGAATGIDAAKVSCSEGAPFFQLTSAALAAQDSSFVTTPVVQPQANIKSASGTISPATHY
jgi:hypothetical protein